MPFIDKRKNVVGIKGIKVPSQALSVCETRRQLGYESLEPEEEIKWVIINIVKVFKSM